MTGNRRVLPGFVVFEGLDGAGTTTQTRLLCERLRAAGRSVMETSEPTTGPIGRLVRTVLGGTVPLAPATVAYLFAADRNEHLFGTDQSIVQALQSDSVVVSDRYFFSSLAYQSVETSWDTIVSLNARFPLPEVVVFVSISVDEALERLANRSAREIYEHAEFQQKVAANYQRALAELESSEAHLVAVDGSRSQQAIHDEIWSSHAIQSILTR